MDSGGDRLLVQLAAFANPHRLRILAALHVQGRNYVSALARRLQIGRPLLHLHLQKLEDAGLVTSKAEIGADGKALNYYQIVDFDLKIDPAAVVEAAATLSAPDKTEP